MSYKDDLHVDKNNLDYEWTRQPELFIEWAEKAVEAQFGRDKLKSEMELIRAELDAEIRANPGEYGLDKITESAINNVILKAKKYKTAQLEYLEAAHAAKVLDVARDAFEHKKKALEKLTELYISGYFSQPSIPSSSREQVEEGKKQMLRREAKLTRRIGGGR